MKTNKIKLVSALACTGALSAVSVANSTTNQGLRDGMRPVPTEGAPVSPTSGNNIPEMFRRAAQPDQRISLPHPPFDEIPWMPTPESEAPGVRTDFPGGESTMTFHDATTNETRVFGDIVQSGVLGAQSIEGEYQGFGNIVDTYDETLESFGGMTQATGLSTWPRSGNVKLVMRFTDINGNFRWFACSGSMQDPGVVLTAAHCLYNRAADISDWADIVYVYPAWDGNNNNGPFGQPDSDEVIQNFGAAYGTSFIAGSNYVNNGDWDADLGLIRLTRGGSRNIGMLTGWYAWAWGGSCASIQSRTYNNFSYPSENCPTPGLHNGRDMYFWAGSVDDCPDNQMELTTGGNCLDTVWGGMSGSGMYYIEGDNRYVHSVCSTSNRNDWGRYCKLWETFVNDMQDFENNTRGNTFDLEALQFRTEGSTSVYQGQAMDEGSTVAIINATNADPASDQYTLRVYLSSNNNISSGDVLLATWNYTTDFAPMQNRTFNVPAPTIPLNTPPGDYWIGVEIDTGTDSTSANNDTDTWDAQPITVLEAFPDLEAIQADAAGGTYYRGETITVNHRTENNGQRISGNVHLEFRASTNNVISSFDTLMGERNYSPLAINNAIQVTSFVQIPADLSPGDYYIGTIVDDDSGLEINAGNNWVADTFPITVLACEPDLTGDGQVNFFDVSAFLSAFNSMDPIADFNNDGNYNFFDVSLFLAAFNAGCP